MGRLSVVIVLFYLFIWANDYFTSIEPRYIFGHPKKVHKNLNLIAIDVSMLPSQKDKTVFIH